MQNTLVKIPIVLRADWIDISNLIKFQNPIHLHPFWVFEIFVRPAKVEPSPFHLLNGCTQIYSPTGSCHGPRNSRFVSLVWPLPAAQSSTRRLAMDFYLITLTSHAVILHANIQWWPNNSKIACICLYRVRFPTCIGIPGFVYVGAIFSAVNIRQCHIPTCQDSARMWFAWQINWQCSCLDWFPRSICFNNMLQSVAKV